LSPTWSQQASLRDGVRPGRLVRANAFPARKTSTAKSSEPLALAPSTFSPARGTSYLPSEIGFLAHYGVSFARLANAVETARAQGVTADRVLIAEGQISEDNFYRALARHLRLTFIDADIALNAGPYPQMIEAGAVALAPGQSAAFLVAPCGAAIGRLIAAMSRRGPGANIALTTPSHLSWLVRKAATREIGRAASFSLPDFDANLCARGGMNAQQGMVLGVLGSIAAFFLPLAPVASITIGAALLGIALLATFWQRLSACAASPKPRPSLSRALSDDELPFYSIVIALSREAHVVSQLLGAIGALAYPRAKLDVKLVLEQDDRETLKALQRLGVPPFCEVIVAPPGVPQTKPRALNVALPLLRGKFVAVYDAEDIPDPQQLRLAASRFAEAPARLACLQAQLAIDNIGDGWLPKLFAIEYAALFDVINTGLSALRIPFSLGGTSNHFRGLM
jgi:glycosyltransferase XagB